MDVETLIQQNEKEEQKPKSRKYIIQIDDSLRNLIEEIRQLTLKLPTNDEEKSIATEAVYKYGKYLKTNYGTYDSSKLFSTLGYKPTDPCWKIPSVVYKYRKEIEKSNVEIPKNLYEALELLKLIRRI